LISIKGINIDINMKQLILILNLILILLKQLIYSNIRNQAEEIMTLEILVLKRMNEEGFRDNVYKKTVFNKDLL